MGSFWVALPPAKHSEWACEVACRIAGVVCDPAARPAAHRPSCSVFSRRKHSHPPRVCTVYGL